MMALPWFPFHLDAYTGDTMHLTTEEHGAYLLLMIAYYRTEKPLPGYDRALAAIAKLPLDRWLVAKVGIAPFFREEGGLWHHDRIEAEMRDASDKHAARIAQRTAAAEARWGKKSGKTAGRMRPASPPKSGTEKISEPKPPRNPARMRPALRQQSGEDAHIQEQEQIYGGGGRAGAREANDPLPSPAADSVTGIEDQLDGTHADDGRIPIDLWKPDISGMTADDLALLNQFAAYHMDEGTFSRDWPSLWQKYRDDAKPKPKRAPPRVETNKRPEPLPGARVKISPDAMALAGEIERMCGLEHHPATVGLPLLLETWLSAWPSELIVGVIRNVMEQRNGEPPKTFKYFETAIARAFADTQRGVPTAAATTQGTTSYDRRKANSTSEVARRLAAEFEARDAGKRADGGEVLRIADGTVQAQ